MTSTTSAAEVMERPWGAYRVLEAGEGYQVKRLEIAPGRRLSYQTHAFRSEHWTVVAGTGTATLEGQPIALEPGISVDVPVQAAHRLENTGVDLLVLIEVQRGTYLGEDDIVRVEDDYGRAGPGTDPQSNPGRSARAPASEGLAAEYPEANL